MEDKPLIIQTDKTLLLEVDSPAFEQCRDSIMPFAELIKSPEHIHTYSISNISLWNAISAGLSPEDIKDRLNKWTKFAIPQPVLYYIDTVSSRFGKILLVENDEETYRVEVKDHIIFRTLIQNNNIKGKMVELSMDNRSFTIKKVQRGNIKVDLIKIGFPVFDMIPIVIKEHIQIELKEDLILRDYQIQAANAVLGDLGPGNGYGTIVLPCGAGKTVIGISIMARLKTPTLIICPNIIAARQWINEIVNKTNITREQIGEYSGEKKEIKDITVCTYQVLIHKNKKKKKEEIDKLINNNETPINKNELTYFSEDETDEDENFSSLSIVNARKWGLLLFDEVHMLPANMFRFTAALQSAHRIGMTATLIREDGLETDVFSLIGPKRYDIPWTVLEKQGWIAEAVCTEIRVGLPESLAIPYAIGTRFEKNKLAATNPNKINVVLELVKKHQGEFILVIGQYLDQLQEIGQIMNVPVITGAMANKEREKYFNLFRSGEIQVLIVSKVANFAVDLPDASVAIQISGTFGSRQEEAQRLGRILRPKERQSSFYSIISKYTAEEDFAQNRQKFLIEQGYSYKMEER